MASEAGSAGPPVRQAAIVAGGLGTRARGMTSDLIPKALLPLAGVPIVVRQLRMLAAEQVRRVVILGGHLGAMLETALRPEAVRLGLELDIVIEDRPLGTAGCLNNLQSPPDDMLIVYGDMLFDLWLPPLAAHHRAAAAEVTVVVHPNDHPATSDLVVVADDGLVADVIPKTAETDRSVCRNLVPAGIYLAAPAFFARLRQWEKADMIHDVLPALLAEGARMAAYNTPEYLRDTGSPARHARSEQDLLAGRVQGHKLTARRPAVFLDADGTLNEDMGGHGTVLLDQVRLIPGAGRAVASLRDAGLLTVAVTNRPQVAKGLITERDLDRLLGRLEQELAADGGGILDRIYFCPHHPESGFPGERPELKVACTCRKPAAGMLERAAAELLIDLGRSAMIGDSIRDIEAGLRLGLWVYGVSTGYGCGDRRPQVQDGIVPDLMFPSIVEAAAFIAGFRDRWQGLAARLAALAAGPVTVAVVGADPDAVAKLAHGLHRLAAAADLPAVRVAGPPEAAAAVMAAAEGYRIARHGAVTRFGPAGAPSRSGRGPLVLLELPPGGTVPETAVAVAAAGSSGAPVVPGFDPDVVVPGLYLRSATPPIASPS